MSWFISFVEWLASFLFVVKCGICSKFLSKHKSRFGKDQMIVCSERCCIDSYGDVN